MARRTASLVAESCSIARWATTPAPMSTTLDTTTAMPTMDLDFFILGTGALPWIMPESLKQCFREAHVSADAMMTGPAVRTYNVMLMENRRVGAGLIAVD